MSHAPAPRSPATSRGPLGAAALALSAGLALLAADACTRPIETRSAGAKGAEGQPAAQPEGAPRPGEAQPDEAPRPLAPPPT